MTNLNLSGFSTRIAYCEAKGLSNVFTAYSENCCREDIMEIGFNGFSGYVYIALENGVSICSCMGQGIEYLVTDFDNGYDKFFEDYNEALNFQNTLYEN